METPYIYTTIRTPRGRGHAEKGGLRNVRPIDLLKVLFNHLTQVEKLDNSLVEDISLGCNTVYGEQGANLAKIATLYSGWSDKINGVTLSSFCTSGLEAIQNAAMKVMTGAAQLTIAGGVESMSRVPMFSDKGEWFSNVEVIKKSGFVHMGIAADIVAKLNGISSDELNEYTLRSHQLAAKAWTKKSYTNNVIPVLINYSEEFARDELIRENLKLEKLHQLPKVVNVQKEGRSVKFVQNTIKELGSFEALHNVGNAPGIADAASLVLIGNEVVGKQINMEPIAKIIGFASASAHPTIMLTGVVNATRKVLAKANLTIDDIDLFEVNESFASVPLMYQKELNIPLSKLNVNGGAIAMGHPIGATGGILLGSLITALKERRLKRGLVTICGGAGIAQATLVELV